MKRFFKFILFLVLLAVGWHVYQNEIIPREKAFELAATQIPDWIDQQIIKVDGDSRRGVYLEGVRDIVIHYVGNPGSTAQQNRDYYANPSSDVSSHFVIGLTARSSSASHCRKNHLPAITGTRTPFLLKYATQTNPASLQTQPINPS